MIRLRNEGPLQPAPELKGYAEVVSKELQSWPDVLAATHWELGNASKVDGAEFHLQAGGELGHIHLDGEIHVALTRELRAALTAKGLARPFVYDPAWVTASITSKEDAAQASWIFRLAYDRLKSVPSSELLVRVEER